MAISQFQKSITGFRGQQCMLSTHIDEEAQTFIDSMPSEEESALAVVTPDKVIAQDYN